MTLGNGLIVLIINEFPIDRDKRISPKERL